MGVQQLSAPVTAPVLAALQAPAQAPGSSVLTRLAATIPDVPAPGPQPMLNIKNPGGTSLAAIPFPTTNTIFSFLDKIGRRRSLLQEAAPAPVAAAPAPVEAAPAPAPAAAGLPGPGFPALPNPDASASSEGTWSQTLEGNMPPGAVAQPQPLPEPQPGAQPEAGAPLPQPGFPAQAPAAQPIAPGPGIALGPVPEDVKVFTTKLANYLGFQAKKSIEGKKIEILPGAGRKLRQEGPPEPLPLPLLPEPFTAEAPMTAPGVAPEVESLCH